MEVEPHPPYAAERLKRMAQIEQERRSTEIKHIIKTDIVCSWCGEMIEDDHYYLCKQHKKTFCDSCAKNDYVIRWDRKDRGYAPNCKSVKQIDCIYEKISLLNDE